VFAIDGDTIRAGGDRIRIRGIDTPKLSEPEGQAAKQRLEELLRSGPVQILQRGHDAHGRILADVFVNGQNVADILKSEGFTGTE
jgi:endonuclease YncB( thermonuclease family)